MKSLLLSLSILCFVILSTVFVSLHTNELLADLESSVLLLCEDGCDKESSQIKEIEREYESIKTHLVLFTRQSDVESIEEHLSDIKSYAKANDPAGMINAKSRLILHIRQLRRLSEFGIEAIF